MKKLWPFEDDCAKLNGNVAAAPHFANVGHVFGVLSGAQIMHTISRFKSWEVRNPMLQTVCDLELKRKSYGCLKMKRTKPKREFFYFTTKMPFGRVFRSCETTLWHTSSTSQLRNRLRNPPPLAQLRKFPSSAKMLQASKMGCEIPILLPNDFQTSKWL